MLKRYDGANTLKWNLDDEPFVVRWVVQKEKDIFVLGAINNHENSIMKSSRWIFFWNVQKPFQKNHLQINSTWVRMLVWENQIKIQNPNFVHNLPKNCGKKVY